MLTTLIRPERRSGVVASATPPEGVVTNPTTISFTASLDHDDTVTAYEARFYVIAGDVGYFDTQELGKPTPTDGVITVALDTDLFPSDANTHYVAYVVALAGVDESEAGVSNAFRIV